MNLSSLVPSGVEERIAQVAGAVSGIANNRILWLAGLVPLGAFVLIRVGLYLLRRTARRAIIQVKKLQEITSQGHFLDLDPSFVERMRSGDKYCRVTSLASYLGSLDYGGDDNVAYKILTTLAKALGGESAMAILPLLPASMLPTKAAIHASGLIARFTLTEFPSVLTLAAAVDTATQFTRQVGDDTANVKLPTGIIDSMDLLARGEHASTAMELPSSLMVNQTVVLTTNSTLRDYVEREMNLGPLPDSKRYEYPKPFSPSLLPGLCRGNGGLEHTDTPRMQCQDRVLSVILNKLAANTMGWCGFGAFSPLDGSPGVPYREFKVILTEEGVEGKPIYTCGEFIHTLVTRGGGSFHASIRTNLTAFGIGLCVLDETADPDEVIDDTDGSKRFRYTQIPLAFCSRTGVVCPLTGDPIQQLSAHSAVEWHFVDNKFLGPGEFKVTFYTGVEGFTGFKPGGEWDRPWVRECDRIRELSYEEAIQAADIAACVGVCSNVCVRLWKVSKVNHPRE